MKKIFLIIVLLPGYLLAQSWNSIVTTTINEPNLVKLENFSNKDGIHIVAQNSNSSNSIKYYKLNSSGTVQTTTTIESQGGAEFPSIAGDNDHLYISYRLSNNIVTKKYIYTNGTWESQTSVSLNNHDCDGVDNAYSDDGLHLVYSESDETHYYLYASSIPTKHKVVSDQSNYYGSTPTITISSDKAHVGFNSIGYAKTRDKNLTTYSWENTQAVVSGSEFEKVQSGCDNLFDFYHVYAPGVVVKLYVKERDIDGTSWSTALLLNGSVHPYPDGMITSTVTNDGKTHILYDSEQLIHRSYNCTSNSWSSEEEITSYSDATTSSSLSSTSNDLYVVYREYAGGSNYLKYCQYDAAPLAPQNLKLTIYKQGTDRYPKLDWSLNNEPDVRRTDNTNAYKIERRTRIAGIGLWSAWLVISQKNQDVSTYTDMSINNAGGGDKEAEYRLKIKDIEDNWSDYSSTVSTGYGMGHGEKRGVDNTANNLIEFRLDQNYPNPFNPSTQIKYTLAKDADVAVKVYDMLGTEVAKLINETQTTGNHTINFNAKNLSSGVYIYRITAINNGRILFADSKQMLLIK